MENFTVEFLRSPGREKFPPELTTWSADKIAGVASRCAAVSDSFGVRLINLQRAFQLGEIDSERKLGYFTAEALIEESRGDVAVADVLRDALPARHPSQLYEAGLEGLALLIILLCVRLRWKNLYHGMLTGLFFVLYAVFRIVVELFRQPDHDKTQFGLLTRGQFYSLFMILIGIAFFIYAARTRRRNAIPPASPAASSQQD